MENQDMEAYVPLKFIDEVRFGIGEVIAKLSEVSFCSLRSVCVNNHKPKLEKQHYDPLFRSEAPEPDAVERKSSPIVEAQEDDTIAFSEMDRFQTKYTPLESLLYKVSSLDDGDADNSSAPIGLISSLSPFPGEHTIDNRFCWVV